MHIKAEIGGRAVFMLIMLLIAGVAHAGDKSVFSKTESQTFHVRYNNNPIYRETDVNNNILEELARITLKDPYSVELGYRFSVSYSIDLSDLNNYSAGFTIQDISCFGDIKYKDFSLAPWLKPDFASFRARVLWRDNLEIATWEFKDIPADENGYFNGTFGFTDLNGGKHYIAEIDQVVFTFTSSGGDFLAGALSDINDLYSANYIAGQIVSEMNGFFNRADFSDPEVFITAFDIRRVLDRIDEQMFLSKLAPPAELENSFNEQMSTARYKLNSIMLHLPDFLDPEENRTLFVSRRLADFYVDRICSYFEGSMDIDYDHRNFFYDCGIVDYNSENLSKTVSALSPRRAIKSGILQKTFFDNVFEAYLKKAEFFIAEQNYRIASDLLDNAEDLYDLSGKSKYPVSFNTLRSRTDYGIYDSYLTIANRASGAGNYNLAETYVTKACIFQKNNSSTIISGEEVKKTYENLIDLYIIKAANQLENKKYGEALYCYNKSEELSGIISRFNFDYAIEHGILEAKKGFYRELLERSAVYLEKDDIQAAGHYFDQARDYRIQNKTVVGLTGLEKEIEHALTTKRFYDLYSNGLSLFREKNYPKAFEYLREASHLQSDFGLNGTPDFTYFLQAAAKQTIMKEVEIGLAYIISDSIRLAEEQFRYSASLVEEYGLEEDSVSIAASENLRKKITAKKCQQKQIGMERLIHEARIESLNANYINCQNILNRALEISTSNLDCDFSESDSILFAALNTNMQPAQYQISLNEARQSLENNDFDLFASVLNRILLIHRQLEQDGDPVEQAPLQNLIIDPFYENKLIMGLDHFLSHEQYEACLNLLNVFKVNGFPEKKFTRYQQKLAEGMAFSDLHNSPSVNPSHKIMEYTGNSDWFGIFNRTYIGAF